MPLRNCGKQKCLGALRKLPVQRRPPLVDRPREPVTQARRGGPDVADGIWSYGLLQDKLPCGKSITLAPYCTIITCNVLLFCYYYFSIMYTGTTVPRTYLLHVH